VRAKSEIKKRLRSEKIPGEAPKERKKPSEGAMEAFDFIGEQKLTAEDRALKEEAYSRLELWEQDCHKYHEMARKCRLIYRLQDPDQDLPNTPPEERMLQLQTLKSTINNCVADQIDNLPEALLLPQRPEALRHPRRRTLLPGRLRLPPPEPRSPPQIPHSFAGGS
jgi:hypothetical protein